MRFGIKLKLLFFLSLASVNSIGADDKGAKSEKPGSLLWDIQQLSKSPVVTWQNKTGRVRSLYYKSVPYQGKPTDVFAYYATPGSLAGEPSKDKNLPGIVLLHGGGGKAFSQWAELWASRGYAAIAMSLASTSKTHHMRGWNHDTFNVKEPATESWPYHAVANAIHAHSLLLSFPEVDKTRTAVTGISWGGYLTCITASVDSRFKAAVAVYGCGFLHENSAMKRLFNGKTNQERLKQIQLWDPSSYTPTCKVPMLMCNGGKDFAYPPDSHAKTYASIPAEKNLHFVPDLKHGHIFNKPHAVEIFIANKLKSAKRLAKVAAPVISKGMVTAKVATATELVSAQLHYCLEKLPGNNRTRQFTSVDATLEKNTIHVKAPPKDTTFWWLTVTDKRKVTTSSKLQFVK